MVNSVKCHGAWGRWLPRRIGHEGEWISSRSDPITISRDVYFGSREYVGVPYPPPDIDEFSSVLRINDISWRNARTGKSRDLAAIDVRQWGYDTSDTSSATTKMSALTIAVNPITRWIIRCCLAFERARTYAVIVRSATMSPVAG